MRTNAHKQQIKGFQNYAKYVPLIYWTNFLLQLKNKKMHLFYENC